MLLSIRVFNRHGLFHETKDKTQSCLALIHAAAVAAATLESHPPLSISMTALCSLSLLSVGGSYIIIYKSCHTVYSLRVWVLPIGRHSEDSVKSAWLSGVLSLHLITIFYWVEVLTYVCFYPLEIKWDVSRFGWSLMMPLKVFVCGAKPTRVCALYKHKLAFPCSVYLQTELMEIDGVPGQRQFRLWEVATSSTRVEDPFVIL